MIRFLSLLIFLLSLPGFGQEDDDKLLRDLEEDRKKQVQVATDIDKTSQEIQEKLINAHEELRKLGHETITAASLLDERVVNILKEMLLHSPLQRVNHEEARTLLLESAKGKIYFQYLSESPRLQSALIDVLRDKRALSSLMGILLRRDDLKNYFFIWIGILICGWIIRKYGFSKEWSFGRRLLSRVALSLLSAVLSMAVFYKMFRPELSPTVEILLNHINKI